ncbi:MAG: helix-turn-helix transcriptional regulator [Clostridia bacterium]|nr:helix-turn-helix transcriptional regulator [Clostridia bacterium]
MFINIGEKIKLHREAKNVSQDELARFLGVTCKEVLKWEEKELYPDFELLPIIANYFGVSTDELLCMEMFDNDDKIIEYSDKFYEQVAAGNIKEAVETMREGTLHFPDEFRLKVLLMHGLYLSCDRPSAIKHYSGEILEIGDDILSHCTDDAIRLEAKRILCLHYYEDLSDTEKARAIAMSLPGRKSCREDMLPIVSEGEAKLVAIQENISSYTSLLLSAITAYSDNDSALSVREKIEFCEIAKKLRNVIYPKGDIFEGAYSQMMLLRDLAVLYMSADEPEKALDCLKECAECAADFDALPKTTPHVSPLVSKLKFSKQQLQIPSKNKKTPLRDIFLNEIISLRCFDAVKYNSRISEICGIFNK